jgi:TPR repeat protein
LGAAGKFGRWEQATGPRKMNLAFMTGWLVLFVAMRASGFVEGPHPGKTIGFWEKAAEENRPRAVKNLRFLLNEFTQKDTDEPVEGVRGIGPNGVMSRDQALGILCNQVASIYAEGKFVSADPVKAAHFFEKACELGNTEGCAHLAVEYFRSNPAVAPDAASQALSTLEQSGAAAKDGPICCLLAYAYDTGRGRPLDKAKAREFYETGAALGEMAAWKTLARMQLSGEGGPADHAAAALWLQKAADAQDGQSCMYLARLYHNGDGVPRDEQKAVSMLEKACGLGIKPACELLKSARQ